MAWSCMRSNFRIWLTHSIERYVSTMSRIWRGKRTKQATIHQELAADRHVLQWRIIDSDGEQNYELVFTSADAVEAFLEASRMMAQKATEYHLRMNSALRHVHELLDNLIAYG